MQDMMVAIGNFGFPMVVTAFLLVRIEGKLGQLNESILLLTRTIAQK
ncbi:YvrJ family protein [Selenomonas sp.]|nr:YvrJ family protein [Selenomonas sp.]MDY3298184.1 YvrJ family protein [Selenomonas sp.]